MDSDAEIDLLFTSGYTLATASAPAPVPCDFINQDTEQQGEEDLGGMLLNMKTVLVRTSAFPSLAEGDTVTLADDEDTNSTDYTVASPPRRIQDGLVMQVSLLVENAS